MQVYMLYLLVAFCFSPNSRVVLISSASFLLVDMYSIFTIVKAHQCSSFRVWFSKNASQLNCCGVFYLLTQRSRCASAIYNSISYLWICMTDQRSDDAIEYRRLYYTKQWKHLRKLALTRDGYRCQHKGCGKMLTSGRRWRNSAVVHHLQPHKGDIDLFYDLDNLQSVCWPCHSGDIQSGEALGYDTQIGDDGWPIAPNHPMVK